MSKICFVKYHGAGNDFILIDNRAFFFDCSLVPLLCHRKFGIGADGVILLEPGEQADFRMRIFNCNGFEAESCGNGLFCLMAFLLDLGLPRKNYCIATGARIVIASFVSDKVSIVMGADFPIETVFLSGKEMHFADTGVPHLVQFVPDVNQIDLAQEAPFFRHHPHFHPRGTNVNFATLLPDGAIAVRTFERGVEGETLACGTGATAVGLIAARLFKRPNPIAIRYPGGELEIHIGEQVKMVGNATKVFAGTFSESVLS